MRALVGTCFGSGSQLAAKSTSLRMSRHFSSCRPSPGLLWPNAMLSIASPGGDMPWPNATGVYAALPAALQHRPHIPSAIETCRSWFNQSISCATARPMSSVGTARPSTPLRTACTSRRHMQGMRVCAGTYHSALM